MNKMKSFECFEDGASYAERRMKIADFSDQPFALARISLTGGQMGDSYGKAGFIVEAAATKSVSLFERSYPITGYVKAADVDNDIRTGVLPRGTGFLAKTLIESGLSVCVVVLDKDNPAEFVRKRD